MEPKNRLALIVANRTSLDLQPYNNANYFIIGIEQGCLEIIEQDVRLDLAIGDFDHVSPAQLERIAQVAIVTEVLSSQKDELDGQAALNFAQASSYEPMTMIVHSSERIDLNLSLFGLMKEYDNLEIINETSIIKKLRSGTHEIPYLNSNYVSFYSLFDNNEVSLKNFVYEADKLKVDAFSLRMLSNAFLENQSGIVENKHDLIMIISK